MKKIILLIMLASAIRVFAGQDYAEEWVAEYVTPGKPLELKKDALEFAKWFDTYVTGASSATKLWYAAKTGWKSRKAHWAAVMAGLNARKGATLKAADEARVELFRQLKNASCKYLKGLQLNSDELEEFETVCKTEA